MALALSSEYIQNPITSHTFTAIYHFVQATIIRARLLPFRHLFPPTSSLFSTQQPECLSQHVRSYHSSVQTHLMVSHLAKSLQCVTVLFLLVLYLPWDITYHSHSWSIFPNHNSLFPVLLVLQVCFYNPKTLVFAIPSSKRDLPSTTSITSLLKYHLFSEYFPEHTL